MALRATAASGRYRLHVLISFIFASRPLDYDSRDRATFPCGCFVFLPHLNATTVEVPFLIRIFAFGKRQSHLLAPLLLLLKVVLHYLSLMSISTQISGISKTALVDLHVSLKAASIA